jgi:type II secretory pathway component GspD/PulD (secretin)
MPTGILAAIGAVSPVFPGFNYVLNATSAQIVLNALTAITQVKVISSPELLVLDNGVAHLRGSISHRYVAFAGAVQNQLAWLARP